MNDLLSPAPCVVSESTLSDYRRDGYIALSGVLTPEEVIASRTALTELVQMYAALSTEDRTTAKLWLQFEPGTNVNVLGDDVPELELKVRKFMNFIDLKPVLRKFVEPAHRIVRIVSELIGPDPILFQDMALVKPPFIGSEKPWHQDNAYFSVTPLESVCGVWIALDDATIENGCMHVLPGWHRRGAFVHHHEKDCEIAATKLAIDEAVAVPIPAGGALFFYGMLPHQTPPNSSPDRRRALQFHFRAASSRVLAHDDYFAVYADENGVPASCHAAAQRGA